MKISRWPLGLLTGALLLLLAGCATTQKGSPSSAKAASGKVATSARVKPSVMVLPSPLAQAGHPGKTTGKPVQPQPPKSLWQRMRDGFRLGDHAKRPRVQQWVKFYASRKHTLESTLQRAEPFMWYIVQQLHKRHMPMELALLPAVESAFNPRADSSSHAVGLWQFLPGTGRRFGLIDNWWYDGRRDVRRSTRAALQYLQYLDNMFNGNWLLAIAAYNAGGGRIQDAVAFNKAHGRHTDFWDLSLPQETATYVPKLLALSAIIDHPSRYGITLPQLPNRPLLKSVKLPGQMDLRLVAKLSGVPLQQVHNLNPGYKRWATPPGHHVSVLLPIQAARRFTLRVAQVPRSHMVTWRRHSVVRGDTLLAIARHYGTTVASIKRINHLHGNLIHVGQNLLIPRGPAGAAATDQIAAASQATGQEQTARGPMHYRVRRNDTLSTIAQHYGTSVAAIRRANHLHRNLIHVGQQLTIPGNEAQARRVASASDGAGSHTDPPANQIHEVRKGETLGGIAQHYGASVTAIRRVNHLHGNLIHVGQKLTIPGTGNGAKPTRVASASDGAGSRTDPPANQIHEVRKGETLGGIAQHYGATVAAIRRANHLRGNLIHVGQKLTIPGKQGHGATATRVASASHGSSTRNDAPTAQVHRVRKGETLGGIAQHYGASVASIRQANHLHGNLIHVGQKLSIPSASDSKGASSATAPSRRTGSGVRYTVRSGDSLWTVAHRYNVSVTKLARWNGLSPSTTLKPGRKLLVLPPGSAARHKARTVYYTVKNGDSLWHIAQLFQVNVHQLESWNDLRGQADLKAGQRLKVVLNDST